MQEFHPECRHLQASLSKILAHFLIYKKIFIGEKYIIDTRLPTKEKTTETTVRNLYCLFPEQFSATVSTFFCQIMKSTKPNQTIFKTEDLIYHLDRHFI